MKFNLIILFTLICILPVTAAAGTHIGGVGYSELDAGFGESLDGLQISAMSLNAAGPFGVGLSLGHVTADRNTISTTMSGFLSFSVVSTNEFQLHLFANSPTYYSGGQGQARRVDDGQFWDNGLYSIPNHDRTFSGYVNGYVGPIILFSPNNGQNFYGLKVNIGENISGFELLFSF